MQKNVASQKWVVFAFDETDNTAKTGDAANITANVRIDGAGANSVDDVNPTELEDGYYIFDITAAESNGDNIVITPASATANIQVIGVPGAVWTTEPNRNKLSVDSNGRIDVIKVAGTSQTANDNGADINAILEDTGTTLENRQVTIATDAARLTAARAGVLTDWINGGRLDILLDAIKIVTDLLADSASTIESGTVSHDNSAATTTNFWCSDITEATADHYKDRIIIFTSGALQNQASDITAYSLDTGEGKFTVTALTEAPGDNDTFVIV